MNRIQANGLHVLIWLVTAPSVASGLVLAHWAKWEISEGVWRVGWGIVVICTILIVWWFLASNHDNEAATVPTNTNARQTVRELSEHGERLDQNVDRQNEILKTLAEHSERLERLEARPIETATKEPTAQDRVIAHLQAVPNDTALTTRDLAAKLNVSAMAVSRAKRKMQAM